NPPQHHHVAHPPGRGRMVALDSFLQPQLGGLREPAVAMSLFGLFFLIQFLLGQYSAGIARMEKQRLLRPGASYLLLSAYLNLAATISIAAYQFGFPRVD